MYDKHFENEGASYCRANKVTNQISIRLSNEEIEILKTLYPDKNISYSVRSLIHERSRFM